MAKVTKLVKKAKSALTKKAPAKKSASKKSNVTPIRGKASAKRTTSARKAA